MTIDPIERTNLVLSAGAVAASLALASTGFALSLAIGAATIGLIVDGVRGPSATKAKASRASSPVVRFAMVPTDGGFYAGSFGRF